MPSQRVRVLVRDPCVDQMAAAGHADLPGVVERAVRADRGCLLDVDVGTHDQRRVPAEFQVHPLEPGGRRRGDGPSGPGRAGERDDRDLRVLHEGGPDVGASWQHVQQSLGQSGLFEDPGEHDPAGHAGPRIGLEDHGVAERERGGHGTDGQDQRGVEGGDDADDADRHAAGEGQSLLPGTQQLTVGRRGEGGGLMALAGATFEGLEGGERADGARLTHQPGLDLLLVPLEQCSGTAQDRGAIGVRPGRPLPLGLSRALRGLGDVSGRRRSALRQQCAGCGFCHGDVLAAALDPAAREDPSGPLRIRQQLSVHAGASSSNARADARDLSTSVRTGAMWVLSARVA